MNPPVRIIAVHLSLDDDVLPCYLGECPERRDALCRIAAGAAVGVAWLAGAGAEAGIAWAAVAAPAGRGAAAVERGVGGAGAHRVPGNGRAACLAVFPGGAVVRVGHWDRRVQRVPICIQNHTAERDVRQSGSSNTRSGRVGGIGDTA